MYCLRRSKKAVYKVFGTMYHLLFLSCPSIHVLAARSARTGTGGEVLLESKWLKRIVLGNCSLVD